MTSVLMASAIGLAAAGYGAAVAALYLFQRRLLYRPEGAPAGPAACGLADMREVMLRTADGLDLLAWYRPATAVDGTNTAADAAPVLLFFHGNDQHLGTRADKLRLFLDAGFGVLAVSYRGYGGNPGRPTEAGLYEDARAALAFLRAGGVDLRRIAFYGESLGSGVAVQLATEAAPAALVLEAPYSSLADVAARRYPLVPVRLLLRDRFDSLAKIGAVRAPLLIVHGDNDRTVPIDLGRRLLAAANEPKEGRFFADAEHTDLHLFGAADAAIDFVRRHVPAPAPAPRPEPVGAAEQGATTTPST